MATWLVEDSAYLLARLLTLLLAYPFVHSSDHLSVDADLRLTRNESDQRPLRRATGLTPETVKCHESPRHGSSFIATSNWQTPRNRFVGFPGKSVLGPEAGRLERFPIHFKLKSGQNLPLGASTIGIFLRTKRILRNITRFAASINACEG